MKTIAASLVWVLAASSVASAQGGSVSGFDRPLGRKTFGGGKGGLSACAPKPNEGPCRLTDYEDAFVIPSEIWGDAIEASGCPRDQKAALTARLESAAAAFNGGVLVTRKALGDQTSAQEGVLCARAAADETRYVGKQRMIFYSRWQDEVRSRLAQCPPPSKEAPKAKRRAARRAAMCRWVGADARVSGGCETLPATANVEPGEAASMIHESVRSCPEKARTMTGVVVHSRRANFKIAEEFNRIAANDFLEAQAGVRCDEVLDSYRGYAETTFDTFRSAWLEKTAAAGAACRDGAGN
ncbi:MAG: hypothetical protein HYX59_01690 [Elusimicrobia bacterium]|nr:hypothetical protein [Elusimicrobiota bacterium]